MDELDTFCAVFHSREVDHGSVEAAVLLGADALDERTVQVPHSLQPALGMARRQTAVLASLRLDVAVAAMQLTGHALAGDDGDLLRLLLEPLDGTVLAVNAHPQAVVVADGKLAGPVHAGIGPGWRFQ